MRDIVKEYQKKFRRNHQRARRYTALLALALDSAFTALERSQLPQVRRA